MQMTDREYLCDCLSSQKLICRDYDLCASECADEKLRQDVMAILADEHQIQHDLFEEMQKHGWYPVKKAGESEIAQARQKFKNSLPL